MLNQKQINYIILFAFLLNTSFIYGQDSESNYVVTFTKSSLKPMSEVEDGSGSERKELFEDESVLTRDDMKDNDHGLSRLFEAQKLREEEEYNEEENARRQEAS